MANVGIAAQFIGGVLNTFGNVRQSQASESQLRQEAFFLGRSARDLELNRDLSLNMFDYESKHFLGKQVSAFSKAGVDLSGSALSVLADTKMNQAIERNIIRRDFDARITKMKFDQQQARKQAGAMRENRPLMFFGGMLGASGNLLSS